LYTKCTKIYTHICQKQSTWIAHKLQRFLLGLTLAVLANAKNASRLFVAARVHAPGTSNTIEGVAPEGRVARKKLAEQTADKKAAL